MNYRMIVPCKSVRDTDCSCITGHSSIIYVDPGRELISSDYGRVADDPGTIQRTDFK